MGEKTEKATPKKLRDAKKKGQVAKAQDLPAAFTFMASLAATLGLGAFLYHQIGDFLVASFKLVTSQDHIGSIVNLFYQSFLIIFVASMPVLGLVSLVGVLVTFITVGPVFAPEVFKFDIKKFDMVANLKAKFKMKTMIELVKQIFKISVACYLIYGVVYESLPVLAKAVGLPLSGAFDIFYTFLFQVIVKVGIFFLFVAIADFAYQKYNFGKEMMMEKFEIKQEYKNTEGDPHIKGRRRQIAQEIAYQEGASGAVQRAQAVVTNPTHLAIALGYEREVDAAPYILAMGQGTYAQQIVKLAEQYGIPIMRNIPLAHKLWEEGKLYEYVPEESYEAIAEILRWVATLKEHPSSYSDTEQ